MCEACRGSSDLCGVRYMCQGSSDLCRVRHVKGVVACRYVKGVVMFVE